MSSKLLQAQGITAAYGDAQALFGIDFSMQAGEIVALIGRMVRVSLRS